MQKFNHCGDSKYCENLPNCLNTLGIGEMLIIQTRKICFIKMNTKLSDNVEFMIGLLKCNVIL
jgi:hypothetical protein